MINIPSFEEFLNENNLVDIAKDYIAIKKAIGSPDYPDTPSTRATLYKVKDKLIQLAQKPEFHKELIKLLPDEAFINTPIIALSIENFNNAKKALTELESRKDSGTFGPLLHKLQQNLDTAKDRIFQLSKKDGFRKELQNLLPNENFF